MHSSTFSLISSGVNVGSTVIIFVSELEALVTLAACVGVGSTEALSALDSEPGPEGGPKFVNSVPGETLE